MHTRSQNNIAPTHTDVTIIIDRSGSMTSCGESIRQGSSDMIFKHAMLASKMIGYSYNIRIVSFDDKPLVLYDGPAISFLDSNKTQLSQELIDHVFQGLRPRGRTRLIRTLIEEFEYQYKRIEEQRNNWNQQIRLLDPRIAIHICVFTDGLDNIGGNKEHLRDLVCRHQNILKAGCQFVAANQNAKITGARFGFTSDMCLQMDADPEHARAAMECVTNSIERNISGDMIGFSEVERTMSSQDPRYTYKL